MFPFVGVGALAVLATVALQRSQPTEALALAERGMDAAATSGPRLLWNESMLRLARAEALHTLGRTAAARTAIREARDRVLRIADSLDGHPDLRESYLTTVVANARTLELASEWLGDP
jgi:hypothetical protein